MVKKMKKLVSITLFLVISSIFVIQPYSALAADYPGYIKVSSGSNYLTAGQENPINIMLKNTGTSEVYEVEAILSFPTGTPGISIISGSHTLVHKILEGNTYTINPVIYVDENTPFGVYTIQLQISYNKWNSYSSADDYLSIQLNVVVNNAIESKVMIENIVEDSSVTSGIDQTLSYRIENLGTESATDLSISISSSSPYFSVLNGSKITKNILNAGESFNHEFLLRTSKNTPIGVYQIISSIYYNDNKGIRKNQITNLAYSLDKISKPKVSVEVSLVNPRLVGGVENTVNVSTMNMGEGAVNDVDVSFVSNSPYIVVLGNGRLSMGGVSPAEMVFADSVFAVSRNAPVGVYSVMATVSYDDDDGIPQVETYTLGLSVESISVSEQTSVILTGYETSLNPVHPGDTFDLELNLGVIGATAQDVKAILSVDSSMTGISSMSPSQVYLGNIEPGEEKNASYSLLIGGLVRSGQYPLRVTVSYLDSEGMMRSLSETLTLDVRGIINFRLINYITMDVVMDKVSELETNLLLVGTENVDFVSIEVVDDEYFDAVVGSYEYVGAVDPDSPIPFDLKFKVADRVEGEQTLKLKLLYTDDLNKEYETVLNIPVNVVENTLEDVQADTGGFWGWLRSLFGLGP